MTDTGVETKKRQDCLRHACSERSEHVCFINVCAWRMSADSLLYDVLAVGQLLWVDGCRNGRHLAPPSPSLKRQPHGFLPLTITRRCGVSPEMNAFMSDAKGRISIRGAYDLRSWRSSNWRCTCIHRDKRALTGFERTGTCTQISRVL